MESMKSPSAGSVPSVGPRTESQQSSPELFSKHLDYMQATIARLGTNSFQLKGWSVGLGSVLIGLAAKDTHPELAWIALIPILAFWALDGLYLSLERNYRDLFNRATGLKAGDAVPALSMDAGSVVWKRWIGSSIRASVLLVHLPLAVIAIVMTLYGLSVRAAGCAH
jgi:hypothetical protein